MVKTTFTPVGVSGEQLKEEEGVGLTAYLATHSPQMQN